MENEVNIKVTVNELNQIITGVELIARTLVGKIIAQAQPQIQQQSPAQAEE